MSAQCGSCGGKVRDGYLCRRCARQLREALTDLAPGRSLFPGHALGPAGRGTSTRWDTPSAVVVGGLADHLETTVARLARLNAPAKRGKGDLGPVSFHEKGAEVRALLVGTLGPWAAWLLELERPAAAPPRCPHRSRVGVDCRACAVEVPVLHAMRRARWARTAAAVREGDVGAIAAYLLDRMLVVLGRDEAPRLHGDVVRVVKRVEKVIDREPDRVAVGDCGASLGLEDVCPECGADVDVDPDGPDEVCGACGAAVPETTCQRALYVDPEAAFIDCPACDARWKVADRRAWLLKAAEDSLGNAATIATALTRLEQPVTADRIYKWKERGRLKVHGREAPPPCREHQGIGRQPQACEACRAKEGAPLYRLGDVVDLLVEAARAEEARSRKRAAS